MTKPIRWRRGFLPAAALVVSVASAAAQTPLKAWPDQQPQPPQQQQKAWPGDAPPAQQAPQGWPGDNARSGAAQPAAVQPFPQGGAPPAQMGAPPPGMGMGGGGPPRDNPCMAEFTRLRGEVEKAGKVARAVNDRKGTRDEFCKAITGLHGAQVKWVKYTQDNQKQCGVPPDVIVQLKAGQANLAKIRTNVCSAGPAAGGGPGGAPSLSEALGTSRMGPTDDAPKKRGGSLDTLTGQSIR